MMGPGGLSSLESKVW